ncbi:MAG: ABC transporter transmembrane domain-containing protein [Nocardioides sp.]
MRDYPPQVTAFVPATDGSLGEPPDTRTPAAFLRWTLRRQPTVIAVSTLVGVLWQLPLTVGPWLFGKAVDHGILPGDWGATLWWAGLLLVVTLIGATFGIAMHTMVVRSWLIGIYGTMLLVARKAVQMGHILPRRVPTGEVLSVAASDSDEFGAFTEILARASAQLVAYLTVAFIVIRTSVPLGLLVLLAAPVLVGVAMPLLRPLHRRQELERTRNSDLTSLATDIVAGLRILRGIGGERTFGRNYAAQSQSARVRGSRQGCGRRPSRRSGCCSRAPSWCCWCGLAWVRCSRATSRWAS